PAAARIARARAEAARPGQGSAPDDVPDAAAAGDQAPVDGVRDDAAPVDGPRDGEDGDGGPDDGRRPEDGGPGGGPAPSLAALAARANLTIPLATLLGLAGRPGAAHGLGPLDPALARDLAAAAAASPHSHWCVTVTDPDGIAVGHGCARPARNRGKAPPGSRDAPPPRTRWAFTPAGGPGPPEGDGTGVLTLPGGRELALQLGPVPVTGCDHRHETPGYQPSDMLRHLVEIRDGTCTFPPCSRHARHCDFEHTTPHQQGGRTCACNGAARSR